ncbi:MAG: DUF839 domain-containing protein [Roseiflexaceae bacterium]|nr:DUF839 domain-containing protein [Roseiflexaceae bacterium]
MLRTRNQFVLLAFVAGLLLVGNSTLAAPTPQAGISGPSSSVAPYVVSVDTTARLTSILTVGDSVNTKPGSATPYRMVGIPDGLGAFDNGDGTFTVLMNHELGSALGIARAHGGIGAFVSKWVVRKDTLTVVSGADLIQQVATWNTNTSSFNAPTTGVVFNRFCSADLPPLSAFYNAATGNGYNGRIFMNGEEAGAEGRAFGHLLDGTTYELPRLGKFSWENSLAHPAAGDKTIVAGTDDGTGGQVYIYVGTKTNSGSAIDKAGLNNGTLYGVKVTGVPAEISATGIASGTAFTLADLGNVANTTGAALETQSVTAGVTTFLRPEDGAWDPSNPNDFYFVTTNSFAAPSRLWRLRFTDATNPTLGGTISMLLDGTEGPKMMDNMTISKNGQILIQEDPGNQTYVAKIWRYSIAQDTIFEIAKHDPAVFDPAVASPLLTQDEESSGILDVSDILGDGTFLFDVQAHVANSDPELVERGQLNLLRITSSFRVGLPAIKN